MNEQTAVGTPVVRKNGEGTFDIVLFGDVTAVVAGGFKNIEEVGRWVRQHDGALGAVKNHEFLGRYREVFLPVVKQNACAA